MANFNRMPHLEEKSTEELFKLLAQLNASEHGRQTFARQIVIEILKSR